MSYTVTARCESCGHEVVNWTPTWNLRPLFKALGIHPEDFAGKSSRMYAEALGAALVQLNERLADYEKHDAPNGWGTARELREQLPRLISEFAEAGDLRVRFR